MNITRISSAETSIERQRCVECDIVFLIPTMSVGRNAYCPRCRAQVSQARDWPFARLVCLALLMLVMMPLAWTLPLLQIRLLGMPIAANVMTGIMHMLQQGDLVTAVMIAFCVIGTPLALCLAICYLAIGERFGFNLRPVLLLLKKTKEWIMFDIYLLGVAVAAIKVQDYADLFAGYGLVAFISLTLLYTLLIIHLNLEQLWRKFYPQPHQCLNAEQVLCCLYCHYNGTANQQDLCPRCHLPFNKRQPNSLQKTWAALISSIILLVPANFLPISIIYVSGSKQEDTLFTGIISLASGNIPIAIVVFIASIFVPIFKVIVMLTLLLSIHCKSEQGLKTRIRLLRAVRWIGRWSMLDLFVISLTMSLVDRSQLLAFTMGPAAVYFGAAVFLTLLSVEWLDSRLLWDAHATKNADYID